MALKSTQNQDTNSINDITPPVAQTAEFDEVVQAIVTDEYAGQGGSYTFDPATGKRTKVD